MADWSTGVPADRLPRTLPSSALTGVPTATGPAAFVGPSLRTGTVGWGKPITQLWLHRRDRERSSLPLLAFAPAALPPSSGGRSVCGATKAALSAPPFAGAVQAACRASGHVPSCGLPKMCSGELVRTSLSASEPGLPARPCPLRGPSWTPPARPCRPLRGLPTISHRRPSRLAARRFNRGPSRMSLEAADRPKPSPSPHRPLDVSIMCT